MSFAFIETISRPVSSDPSRVYFELWCRTFDQGFVQIGSEEEHALASGYIIIQRGVRTWRKRTKANGMNKFGFVLLIQPHMGVEKLRKQGKVP